MSGRIISMRDYNRDTNYNLTYIKFSLRCKHLNTWNDKCNIIKPEKAAFHSFACKSAQKSPWIWPRSRQAIRFATGEHISQPITANSPSWWDSWTSKWDWHSRCPRPGALFPRAITAHGVLSPVQYRALNSFDSCEERLNTFRQLLFYFRSVLLFSAG